MTRSVSQSPAPILYPCSIFLDKSPKQHFLLWHNYCF